MSISFFNGSDCASAEAESISCIVEAHLEELRRGALGRTFRLGSASFTLLKRDRNILYRVHGAGVWFLKMPSHRRGDAIQREASGAQVVADSLAGQPGYCVPRAIRVSEKHDYLLSAQVVGQPLNNFFYSAAAGWKRNSRLQTRTAFRRVGSALTKLHKAGSCRVAGATNRPIDQILLSWPAEGCTPDKLAEAAISAVRRRLPQRQADSFIHGNMRMDNVIVAHADAGVTFLDFENCGLGSRYDDLSVLCAQLLLTHTLLWFPLRYSREAVSALLDAYSEEMQCDMEALLAYVGGRLTDYYLGFLASKGGRMAGIPVARSKLKHLISKVAGGELWLVDSEPE